MHDDRKVGYSAIHRRFRLEFSSLHLLCLDIFRGCNHYRWMFKLEFRSYFFCQLKICQDFVLPRSYFNTTKMFPYSCCIPDYVCHKSMRHLKMLYYSACQYRRRLLSFHILEQHGSRGQILTESFLFSGKKINCLFYWPSNGN